MSALEQLVAMGFEEERSRKALEANGFDVERAVNFLVVTSDETVGSGHQQVYEVIQASNSQYDLQSGRSACTCICLEASLTILEVLASGPWRGSPEDLENIVNIGVVTYEGLSGAGTLSTEHTSVSEVMPAVSRYRDSLRAATCRECYQGMLGTGAVFDTILENITSEQRDRSKHVAVAITKPPETVVAFLPPGLDPSGASASSTDGHQQWLLFDSHPRPQIGLTGAYVQIFDRKQALVEALSNLFPALDVGTDNIMASMYNMVDVTPLALKQAAPGQALQAESTVSDTFS